MLQTLRLPRKRLPAHLITLIALMAVLLPTFAPWLDVQFAGRMPQHDHIYVGEVNLNHHKSADNGRKHSHSAAKPAEPAPPFVVGVINLPDRNATPQTLALLDYPVVPLLQRIDVLWFPVDATCYTVCGIAIPPLDEPPRL